MRKYAVLFAIVFLLASLTATSKVNVRTAKAEDIFHEGDLILSGNNVTIIENQVLHINGSILITENATLIIRNNGLINFTQQYSTQFNMTLKDPVDGNPRLIMENNGSVTGNDWHIYLIFMPAAYWRHIKQQPTTMSVFTSTLLLPISRNLSFGPFTFMRTLFST